MKKLMLGMGMMALMLAPTARGVLVESDSFDFMYGSDTVTVLSEVDLDGGIYTYSYKITSTDLSVFNVAIQLLPGSSVDPLSTGVMADSGVAPGLWQVTDSPLLATAAFTTLVTPGATSKTFYYESTQGPTVSSAQVAGLTANFTFANAEGRVYSPVPEPATMVLLAAGAVLLMRKQRV